MTVHLNLAYSVKKEKHLKWQRQVNHKKDVHADTDTNLNKLTKKDHAD